MRDDERSRDISGELGGEVKGIGQQVKGKVKEETGDLLDDRSMEIEGQAKKNEGKVRREVNNPADAMADDLGFDNDTDSLGNRRPGGINDRDRTSGSGDKGRSGY
jgi:uncharacterized protein YjbJ (UPF0337 family)